MESDLLLHEVPLGLDMRPMVAIRPAPGVVVRAPTRAVIVVGVALVIGCGLLILGAPWAPSLAGVGIPAAVVAWVAEGRVHGRRPLVWAWVVIQHHVRPGRLARGGYGAGRRRPDAS